MHFLLNFFSIKFVDVFTDVLDDFKPASVDINKESTVAVGGDGSVEVTVPHVEVSMLPPMSYLLLHCCSY